MAAVTLPETAQVQTDLRLVKADGRVYTHPGDTHDGAWTLDRAATRDRLTAAGVDAAGIDTLLADAPATLTPHRRGPLAGLTALARRRR